MAKKPLLTNDPLSGGGTGSLMDGILERNRERTGRARPTAAEAQPTIVEPIQEPEALLVEGKGQDSGLYTTPQPDNQTTPQVSLSGSMDVYNAPEGQKPVTRKRSSGKTKRVATEVHDFTATLTVRERAQELGESVKIPPKTLSVRITEEIDDHLNELTYLYRKSGTSKQSLVIALLERGLAELNREERR
ncbi:hypothetical protein [Armatimonas rosea]|uniref:Uncharacterized protein n=1 Tax=Armatimonas rosea TaxID=685828 RepID=A0A7W9SWH0_ARMRO|nr:hypothetical protein [Armatimonas rosea]MBB6054101.1 hypothetical protein [Armatimonas rosea]